MLAHPAAGAALLALALALVFAGCGSETKAPAGPIPSSQAPAPPGPPTPEGGPIEPDAAQDSGAEDAKAADARADASDGGRGGCDPSAVRFVPPGGSLRIGQLCDDVVACVSSDAEAAALMAASKKFQCQSRPSNGCPSWTCLYSDPAGPSLLDEAEIAEICKITVLLPTPRITCFVYL